MNQWIKPYKVTIDFVCLEEYIELICSIQSKFWTSCWNLKEWTSILFVMKTRDDWCYILFYQLMIMIISLVFLSLHLSAFFIFVTNNTSHFSAQPKTMFFHLFNNFFCWTHLPIIHLSINLCPLILFVESCF